MGVKDRIQNFEKKEVKLKQTSNIQKYLRKSNPTVDKNGSNDRVESNEKSGGSNVDLPGVTTVDNIYRSRPE